jgi:hypothetical protein
MKYSLLSILILMTFSSFAWDLGAVQDSVKAKAQDQAEKASRKPADILAVCQDEISGVEACKGLKEKATLKTCLQGHKEQLSQGCQSSLGL